MRATRSCRSNDDRPLARLSQKVGLAGTLLQFGPLGAVISNPGSLSLPRRLRIVSETLELIEAGHCGPD